MTNVFAKRAHAPQFPQRRALRTREPSPFRRGGRVPGYFLGGLFNSTPGSSSTSQNSTTNSTPTSPQYLALQNYVLQAGLDLATTKGFQKYGKNAIVDLTPEQKAGISGASANVGNYSPFYNAANQTIGDVQGAIDPSRGQGFIDQAANMQSGTGAATPFIGAGTQNFPQSMQEYMSPYTDNVVHGIQDASNRNFEQNTMQTINDTFSGGNAAQFGRERHGNAVGNAVFAKTQADDAAVSNALQSGYRDSANIFNADQNRQLQAGQLSGSLAQGDVAQRAGLGQTAAAVQGANAGTGLGVAQAQVGLGQNTQNSGLADSNALLQAGAVGQKNLQDKSNFDYNEFVQEQQFPMQMLNWAQGLSQGWQLPTQSNTQSYGQSSVQQPQGSPFGQILGGAMGLASLATPGAGGTSAMGNIFGGIRGLFAQGGMVPTVGQMRKRNAPKGMQPTGMPGMPAMAPALPQQGTFARGGAVPCFDEGGSFWDADRPMPSNGSIYMDMDEPTGRDAVMRSDPMMYAWRHLPPHIREALSFARDQMPDKMISSALDGSGRMARSVFEGRPMDAIEAGGETMLDLSSLIAPGAARGARAALNPFVQRMLSGAR